MKAHEYYCAHCSHVVMALSEEESTQLKLLFARSDLALAGQRAADRQSLRVQITELAAVDSISKDAAMDRLNIAHSMRAELFPH